MLISKHNNKKNAKGGGTRLLISVTVVGSAGPIRFVVNEDEIVTKIIDTAVKSYNREGRLPVLGSNVNDFVLHCPVVGTECKHPLICYRLNLIDFVKKLIKTLSYRFNYDSICLK